VPAVPGARTNTESQRVLFRVPANLAGEVKGFTGKAARKRPLYVVGKPIEAL